MSSRKLTKLFNDKFAPVLKEFWFLEDKAKVKFERKSKYDPPDWDSVYIARIYTTYASGKNKILDFYLGLDADGAKNAIGKITEEEIRREINRRI